MAESFGLMFELFEEVLADDLEQQQVLLGADDEAVLFLLAAGQLVRKEHVRTKNFYEITVPTNFRYHTMLAGLCKICDKCVHSNFEKLFSLLTDVESATSVSMKQMKARVADYQRFCKTIIQTSREALTLCRTVHELCICLVGRHKTRCMV